jgi:type II secretory pathway pseudopilin PulG
MRQRNGATLIEVLVAIFVMGIGLIAILSLFPLGAIRMAQAIQDDRAGNIAQSANAVAAAVNLRNDPGLFAFPNDPYVNPGSGLPPAHPDFPSYPVVIDPMGFVTASATPYQFWLGGISGNGLSRRSVSFVTSTASAYRWFAFLDDIQFDPTGSSPNYGYPLTVTTTTIGGATVPVFEREYRYSWAYLCQRPRSGDPLVTNMAVVVFNRRSLALTGNLPLAEYYYNNCTFMPLATNQNSNIVWVNWGASGMPPPPVRPGEWIMDATLDSLKSFGLPNNGYAHGNFHRVVGSNDLGGGVLELEVETPFRNFGPWSTTTPLGFAGQIVVLEGVAEVFERGDGRVP